MNTTKAKIEYLRETDHYPARFDAIWNNIANQEEDHYQVVKDGLESLVAEYQPYWRT